MSGALGVGARPLRLAWLGAFAFPAPLGSQRFAAEQGRALVDAGAEVEPFTYGALGGPRRGLDPRKLVADGALAHRLAAAHAARPFDAVLAHNAEAALVALAVRLLRPIPVVYVAHTLWSEELETWVPAPAWRAAPAGGVLDRALARASDGVLVLTKIAERALAPVARGPLARIVPGHAPDPAPRVEAVEAACRVRGLAPDGFVLYAGNVDRYQDLDVLDAAAREVVLPVVVVTHDARGARFRRMRVIETASVVETRLLTHGALAAVLPRRRTGGFPIKLLHYMEAGRAIVARASVAATLVHGESAWLVPGDASPAAFSAALGSLAADDAQRSRLGAGARRALEKHHAWPPLAAATLALILAAIERRAGR